MSHRSAVQILVCAVLLALLSMAGCLGSREWMYPPPPGEAYLDTSATRSYTSRLVVFPLEDQRDVTVQEEYWKIMIPLVWSVVTLYDRPETIPRPKRVDTLKFDPPRDFARAAADEIRNANIFSSVTFHAEDQQVSPDDFILRGHLHSTRWERTISAYLLGPLGTVIWMVGLPMGIVTASVVMDMQLMSASDPSLVLWDFAMEFEGQVWDGAYYGLEESALYYPQAVQEALRPAISELVAAMPTSAQR